MFRYFSAGAPFDDPCVVLVSILPPDWLPFGCLWLPFIYFGSLLAHFGSLSVALGSLLGSLSVVFFQAPESACHPQIVVCALTTCGFSLALSSLSKGPERNLPQATWINRYIHIYIYIYIYLLI